MKSVVVVGAGLIGTSIALGCKKFGAEVELFDKDLRAQKLANDLLNNSKVDNPDLVVIATPINEVKGTFERVFQIYPNSVFIDTGSVKIKVEVELQSLGAIAENFCPTHPMAGRELDGAEAAQSDLFQGRTWVISPMAQTSSRAIGLAKSLIEKLGAKALEMKAAEHDLAVARVSHLPQIISSLLAGQLTKGQESEFKLAGSGIIDTTRIAASNTLLWDGILKGNKEAIMPLLIDFQNDLSTLIANFDKDVTKVLERGNTGRGLLPGKHGAIKRNYTYLPIVIADQPGQLAKLFEQCAVVNVSVEDLAIEHSPGQETGLITLAINPEGAERLESHLKNAGWRVHPPRSEK